MRSGGAQRRGGLRALACGLFACGFFIVAGSAQAAPHATIRWTAHGIPHIEASDYEGLGYGYGYAFASQDLCEMADTYVTVRAERSRFFGPDGSYASRGNGATFNNLDSDFFFQRAIDTGVVERLMAEPPPRGPRPEVRAAVRGYVEGYNRFLADTGVDNLSDPRCRGKDWVRPISELDAYRRFYQLGILASQGVAIDGIAQAQPPPPGDTGAGAPPSRADLLELGDRLKLDIGSNAYGLGREAVAGGGGMVLGNPHFPWDGPERFFQAQLTIPGKVDVAGASLFGVPVVLIGSTRNLAWSHTVSTAFRFTPFEVKLVPGAPTTYLVDGQPHQMERAVVTVDVGGGQQRTRTLYSTKYGPVFTSLLGLPLFPWTSASAYSMGDVNGGNFRYLNHFFETNQAQSVEQYDIIERRYQGIPWVNSIAADSTGKAYYADIGAIPNVSDDKARTCGAPLGLATFQAIRLPVLDGSRSSCDWDDDPDAAVPGIFGPSHEPSLFRDDYVTNSNDSYWLSNPGQPLEGFARIIGDERTARSLRTRLGLKLVEAGRPFTLRRLQDAVFNNRQYAGELWRDQLVDMCEQTPGAEEACPALRAWDLHDDLDSSGAILFRRFAGRALGVAGGPYSTPFDADDPVNTPRGLNTLHPQVRQALLDAIQDLRDSGIPLDAPLRGWQYERRGDERVPIHGGPGTVGVFNAINVPFVKGQGYPNVPHGSSFVQAVHVTGGCPDVRTILTYSQSTNPNSPFSGDQTRMFSRKEWVDFPFCSKDVRAATVATTRLR
jgi:acyl-homoserine-lactone acylase